MIYLTPSFVFNLQRRIIKIVVFISVPEFTGGGRRWYVIHPHGAGPGNHIPVAILFQEFLDSQDTLFIVKAVLHQGVLCTDSCLRPYKILRIWLTQRMGECDQLP